MKNGKPTKDEPQKSFMLKVILALTSFCRYLEEHPLLLLLLGKVIDVILKIILWALGVK